MPFDIDKSKSKKQGFSISIIRFILLKFDGVYLTYHMFNIRIINIK